MIKYLELTAPQSNDFRQVKIVSVEISEGDTIKQGDTLFKVESGKLTIDLPSTMNGKIIEIIAIAGENISSITPLVLLETEVDESTATAPKNSESDEPDLLGNATQEKSDISFGKPKNSKKKTSKKTSKKTVNKNEKNLEQQNLNLANNQSKTVNETPSNNVVQINVPDIGTDVAKVIEIFIKVGDKLSIEDPIITLESDKASMDVPSTHNGIVSSISVLIDQEIGEGTQIIELTTDDQVEVKPTSTQPVETSFAATTQLKNIIIPDIGGDSAKVIEILVEVGQKIVLEDPLVTLESDKASMEVPSTESGTVESIEVKIDQDVSEGVVIMKIASSNNNEPPINNITSYTSEPDATTVEQQINTSETINSKPIPIESASIGKSHASPSIRRFARELGVDLSRLLGTGRKGRILKNDVTKFVKVIMSGNAQVANSSVSGTGIPAIPAVDFSKFGEIDVQPLNKIKRLTAANLHRSWVNVPHVTHNDESDISDLESFRKQLNSEYVKQNKNIKLSPLAFIVKAVVQALQTYPQFNSSLEPGGENLIYKKYINIGIAVETPNGLVVPVLRDADKKSVSDIAVEMGELAGKARGNKLTMKDMSGACFTISSLGGIGGTSFTPIVNSPEVAILGVSRTKTQAVWDGKKFVPGMMLPLSLSYDHRVIDGAEAARFTRQIAAVLEDVRRLTV